MNRWRFVQASSDGCEYYQCLKCKDIWESRTPPKGNLEYSKGSIYCGFCGTKWDGELNWGYDERETYSYKESLPVLWAIQSRAIWTNKDGKIDIWAWQIDHVTYGSAASAFSTLLSYKGKNYKIDDEDFGLPGLRHEWKAIVLKPGTKEWEDNKRSYWDRGYDYRYFEEYQKNWGGKMHDPRQKRRWFFADKKNIH